MSKHNREKRLRPQPEKPPSRSRLWIAIVVAGLAALLAASFVLPGRLGNSKTATEGSHMAGDGPDVGARVTFSEQDAVTGAEISSRTMRGSRTLLFFSEGVMCQACFEQIRDIEKIGAQLERRGIRLVSITPDSSRTLREAIDAYDITSPMISDEDRSMSSAFDTLGKGMHSDMPGHAFVLLDKQGRVTWQRDYWLPPYETMYVEPAALLDDLPEAGAS